MLSDWTAEELARGFKPSKIDPKMFDRPILDRLLEEQAREQSAEHTGGNELCSCCGFDWGGCMCSGYPDCEEEGE